MRAQEQHEIRKAIRHLEANECQWEDAMEILHRLAGWEYKDWRKNGGKPVGLTELMNPQPNAELTGRAGAAGEGPR